MAYNLESLITILEQILNPNKKRWILDHNKPQMESLLEKASSLKQILETSSPATESLEREIREAAHKAEDIIEAHLLDEMLKRRECEIFTVSVPDLQQVIQELDSAAEKARKIMDDVNQMANFSSPRVSFSPDDSMSFKNIVVGLDEDLIDLKDRVTRPQSELEVTPIVGLGGIGKTTLAQTLYNDAFVVSHFDTRAWITVSQEYNVHAILLGLLGCIIGKLSDELLNENDIQLKVILHKSLVGRRYLIVLDDIWSVKAWDEIKLLFPNESEGSRIILTTRDTNVAVYAAGSQSFHHQMRLLNKSQSWNLLRQKVFGNEDCPVALERFGISIAGDCGGLPLAIHVIGGLLSKAKKSEDFWEHVAKDVRAAIAEKDEQLFKILSLSYNHLPVHLKPCFLYMGAFPEDHEIRASRLIKLWVAEGFLSSNRYESLEEEAEDCLKTLVDRNLLSVRQWKTNGKPKVYGVHDLMRDLCVRKASDEKFLYIKNWNMRNTTGDSFRRVSVHQSYRIRDILASEESMSLARSFLCNGLASRVILSPVFFGLRLLRVLDVYNIEFHQFPTEILQLASLRYLAFFCNAYLPNAISRLWNLQTLIVRYNLKARSNLRYTDVPSEVWEMSELRHVKFQNTVIHIERRYRQTIVQEKLQTISSVGLHDFIDSGFLDSIPNIKSLGISCEFFPPSSTDLSHLRKLETLKCSSNLLLENRAFLSTLILPPSIRKLILSKCGIPLGFMETLCALPNLKVLKIRKCVFESRAGDEEWEATEREEFHSLEFLLLEDLNLARWETDESKFPRLRHLVIRDCSLLEEIPCGIGEIPTLEVIALDESSPSAVASAKQIQAKQHEFENYDLQVRIFKN